jgi:hypothetical protein
MCKATLNSYSFPPHVGLLYLNCKTCLLTSANAPPTKIGTTLAEAKAKTAALEAELAALEKSELANQTLKK